MMKYFLGSKANVDGVICITSFCVRGVFPLVFSSALRFGWLWRVETQSGDNQPLNIEEKPESGCK